MLVPLSVIIHSDESTIGVLIMYKSYNSLVIAVVDIVVTTKNILLPPIYTQYIV